MSDRDEIYIRKREFVERLNEAYSMINDFVSVEYRNISDKYSEFIRVTDDCGKTRYIDVTSDSLQAIAQEVLRGVYGKRSDSEITHEAHLAIVEGWFEAAR